MESVNHRGKGHGRWSASDSLVGPIIPSNRTPLVPCLGPSFIFIFYIVDYFSELCVCMYIHICVCKNYTYYMYSFLDSYSTYGLKGSALIPELIEVHRPVGHGEPSL